MGENDSIYEESLKVHELHRGVLEVASKVSLDNNLENLPVVGSTTGFYGALGGVLHKLSGATANYDHDNIWDPGDLGDFNIAKTTNRELNSGDLLKVTIYHRPSRAIISSPEHRV